ncbi:TonB-dependent receptor [Sphingomonas sp. CGMCC 1.13654]|uniref:TonB-dependent receptor n=1 Tax=Sphingomonas chungangi TaxID=2683589 RepID=A0A838L422_9SPHN|nr:TonB-dependent receptor [Sphingomonas chungangi]MBA2933660.1 TonB-dependent receptor [Sphingomonas chungangi]
MTASVRKIRLLSSVAPFLAVGFISPALAQTGGPASGTTMEPPTAVAPADTTTAQQPAGKGAGGLQDIIVTARRTNEKLQTTPVAVTALNNQMLLTKQIAAVTDLARSTPALSIGTGGTGPASIVYLAIRGEAQNSPNSFSDNAVGIYIDGVYVGRPLVGNLGFLDMASAEILRGPQGTLFGRNTTAGALNLTTAQPTDKFEGYVKAGVGNFDQRVAEAVVNVPMTSDLSARFAGRYDKHGGYFPNPYLGHAQGDVAGEYYGRGTIKWAPNSLPVTLTVSGDYTHYRDHGNANSVAAINPTGPLATFSGLSAAGVPGFTGVNQPGAAPITQFIGTQFPHTDPIASNSWRDTYGHPTTGDPEIDNLANFNSAGSATANLVVDLGSVTVKSITGYRLSDTGDSLDLTGTPTSGGAFASEYKQHQFSEELQVSGKIGRLDYIGGLYYFREAGNERSDSYIFYNTPFGTRNRNFADFVSSSKGAYAQVNYHVTDALRLTGGIRYTWDSRFIDRHGVVDFTVPDPICAVGANSGKPASVAECTAPSKAKFHYPAWTAGADYKLSSDVFAYVKTSGASLSGGFNARPVPSFASISFKPEAVRDVEGGFKGEFFNRHLRTNVAVFYAWQKDVQRIVNTVFGTPPTLSQYVSNDGKVHTYGVEFEGTVIPWKGMAIDGSFAYLHARYVKGSRIESELNSAGALVEVDRSGEPITQAPKWTASIGATQTFEFESGKLSLHADYSYISSRYFDSATAADAAQEPVVAIENEASKIKAYGLVNGTITFAFRGGLEFSIWGKNLTNKPWYTNVFNSYTGLGATTQFQGAPRTYGGTAAIHF